MKKKKPSRLSAFFSKFSGKATRIAGSSWSFIIALLLIIAWAATGPIFHYSDTWQLVINTSTTIITFLMVFIIQQTQNRDTMAVHLKLNELIASSETASNRLVDSEDLTEEELITLKNYYLKLTKLAQKNDELFSSHSIDEAEKRHGDKLAHKGLSGKKTEAKNTSTEKK
ncbi:MAG: rane protein [Chitinophagaceae bacterium]|nr:rane protein [Chitinophagaceae bacterium]